MFQLFAKNLYLNQSTDLEGVWLKEGMIYIKAKNKKGYWSLRPYGKTPNAHLLIEINTVRNPKSRDELSF